MSDSRSSIGPAVAGSWYPADPSELSSQVDRLLGEVPEAADASLPAALIAPHAGFVYSGRVAARRTG